MPLKFGDPASIYQRDQANANGPLSGMYASFGRAEDEKTTCGSCAHFVQTRTNDGKLGFECAIYRHHLSKRITTWQGDSQACGKFEKRD